MKLAPLKEYSLWLAPQGKEAEYITEFINSSAKRAKTMKFQPHVTLIGGLYMEAARIIEKMERMVYKSSPFRISFVKPDVSSQFYKSIFLECRNSKKLMDLNKKGQGAFSKRYDYFPHMSLVYGYPTRAQKDLIIKKLNLLDIKDFSFTAKSILLCKAFGAPDKWEIIHETDFKKDK